MRALIIGAGVTGCFTATRLMHKGVDVSVLARGDKAARLERDGLRMRNGMINEEATVRLNIVRAPVAEAFDVAMVCVRAPHRPALAPLLHELVLATLHIRPSKQRVVEAAGRQAASSTSGSHRA